jgi:hypothetical protein
VVFNISSLPLFGFASAASRESPVQAANKQKQADAYRAAVLSVMRLYELDANFKR